MIWFLIGATWIASGLIANRLTDQYYRNAFPGTSDGGSKLIHLFHYVTGPIGVLSSVLWLASDSYGFDGKKSPWRHL